MRYGALLLLVAALSLSACGYDSPEYDSRD